MAFSWFSLPLSGSGKPSTTYSGLLLPADVMPRTRMEVPAAPPGAPPFDVTCTPAARPCRAWVASATGCEAISREPTDDTAPVTLPRCWVP